MVLINSCLINVYHLHSIPCLLWVCNLAHLIIVTLFIFLTIDSSDHPSIGISLVHVSPRSVATRDIRLEGISNAPLPLINDNRRDYLANDHWTCDVECWRLYILYADGRLSCFTFKRSNASLPPFHVANNNNMLL
jgi:hypothetical protein